eukprot:10663117-Prorocentrum_lima.AAC.1
MHQRPDLESKLKKRGLIAPNFGNDNCQSQEGHYQQEDKETPQYKGIIEESTDGSCITTVVGTKDKTR